MQSSTPDQSQNKSIKARLTILLSEGLTPSKLALAITGGIIFGTFPLLMIGVTTLLSISFAYIFKLNKGLIQLVNLACSPLQILFYLPYLKAGQILFRIPFDVSWNGLITRFKTDFWVTLKQLGLLNLAGIAAWIIISLTIGGCLYLVLLKLISHLNNKMAYKASSTI